MLFSAQLRLSSITSKRLQSQADNPYSDINIVLNRYRIDETVKWIMYERRYRCKSYIQLQSKFNLLKNDTKVLNWLAFKWKGNFYYWFICMHLYMYRYMLMWYMVETIDLNPYISMVGVISSKRRQNILFSTLQAQKWAYGSYLPLLFCEYYNV